MGITSSGVKGYEYQYLATVHIALNIGIESLDSLMIEKKGSEDAFVQFTIGSKVTEVEIQMKRERSVLDISKLANWLTHFQEGSIDNNLLHRLKTTDAIALFVTRSRCNDDTVHLKNPKSDIQPHTDISITNNWRDSFSKSLSGYSDTTVTLLSKRKDFCILQSKEFEDKKQAANILKRVLIWEEVEDEVLDSEIDTILNKKYYIPQSQTSQVRDKLLCVVRKGRDEQINIVPLLNQAVLESRAGAPIIDDKYHKRPEEENLFQELICGKFLLLTGTTQCGKSTLAKQIALRLFAKGYSYIISSDILSVTQFFSQNAIEDKIAILEDPWGHLEKSPNSLHEWKRVENILLNLSANHKLIVTSRREIIQNIHSINEIHQKKLAGRFWHDLTLSDSNFLVEYWISSSQQKLLPYTVVELIKNQLETANGEEKLQIGQLQFLASSDLSEILNKTQNELEHIARMSSQEIGESIRDKGQNLADLLSLLSLTSTNTTGLSKTDLAFILSDDDASYSEMEESHFWTSGGNVKAKEYPNYKTSFVIPEEVIHDLEYFERRNFITEEDGCFYFTHPNYFESGRYLFTDASSSGQLRFLGRLKKSLFVINPDTAFLVASQFPFITKKLSQKYTQGMFQLAFAGLNSIYPAVEDRLTVFLIEVMEELTDEDREKLTSKLEFGGAPSSHIFWHEKEIPYISKDGGRGLSDYFFRLENEEMLKIGESFKNQAIVSPFTAWQYLLTIQNSPILKITSEELKALLQYREVFIRTLAAFLFIRRQNANITRESLNDIFSDEHPSVILEGIRGCFISWSMFSHLIKEFLIQKLEVLVGKKPVAIRANRLMTTFASDHRSDSINWENLSTSEKRELWVVWGKLFPQFIKRLPPNVYLRAEHFDLTITEALKYVEYNAGINLLETWYERIDYRIRNQKVPDEYEMCVAHHLMNLTKEDSASRSTLFDKLVTYPTTDFLLSNLKWITAYWSHLNEFEKSKIISVAKSDRIDSIWIKSVLLNTWDIPPTEIQYEILGDTDFFSLDIKTFIATFPQELLLHCLHVYFGHPQPLWWLAIHHHNTKFWNKVIRFILYKKLDPYFDLCLRSLLTNGVNGFSSDWKDGLKIWKSLCRRPRKMLEQTERLIYETASSSCSIRTTRNLWKCLIRAYQKKGSENIIIYLIADHIEILQQTTGGKRDLFDFFGRDFFFDKVYPHLFPDDSIIYLLEQSARHSYFEELTINALEAIRDHGKSLRFYFTQLLINHRLEKYSFPPNIKDILLAIPNNIDEVGEERKKYLEMKLGEDICIWNWIES